MEPRLKIATIPYYPGAFSCSRRELESQEQRTACVWTMARSFSSRTEPSILHRSPSTSLKTLDNSAERSRAEGSRKNLGFPTAKFSKNSPAEETRKLLDLGGVWFKWAKEHAESPLTFWKLQFQDGGGGKVQKLAGEGFWEGPAAALITIVPWGI